MLLQALNCCKVKQQQIRQLRPKIPYSKQENASVVLVCLLTNPSKGLSTQQWRCKICIRFVWECIQLLYCTVTFGVNSVFAFGVNSVLCRRIMYCSVAFGVNSVLCRRILYCAVAFCTVPSHSVLIRRIRCQFCTVPSHSVLCRRILYCSVAFGVNSVLCRRILYCAVAFCTVPSHSVLCRHMRCQFFAFQHKVCVCSLPTTRALLSTLQHAEVL